MATSLSFKDLNITFKKHPVTDDVVVSRDASAIKQAIVNLLLTNKGERLMNPKYGSDIRSICLNLWIMVLLIKESIKSTK